MDLHLELDAAVPKREQLERALRDAVRSGRLHPAARLPPTRVLAHDLGLSRGVVVEAYEQLVAEGWLTARRGSGTHVAAHPTRVTGSVPVAWGEGSPAELARALRADPLGSLETMGVAPPMRFDLRTGRPDLALFPRAAWHAAAGRALRALPDEALGYGDWRGYAPLRAALAAHLGRTRGVLTRPDDLVVCGGLYPALTILWRALARGGARRIAIEDPGWRGQRRSVEAAGLQPVPVPIDAEGIVVDALDRLDVAAVAVTPAHQFPTGVVLSPGRRAQLVAWAQRRGRLVVEDDYDAEYRYDRDPIGALQGLAPGHVVYAGSASKTLAPALRLGWMAVPRRLVAAVAEEKDRADRGTPVLEQATLADLLDRGELDRHLRRTRRRYRARRDALVAALGAGAAVGGIAAGLHVVLALPAGVTERAAAARCLRRDVRVDLLHDACTTVHEHGPALLLGYAALPETAARRAGALVREAVAEAAAG